MSEDRKFWNIGLKSPDIESEIRFFERLGAKLLVREMLPVPDGEGTIEYAMLEYGGTRIFLSPTTVFEDKVPHDLEPGITHAVFETDDIERECRRLRGLGTEALIDPVEVDAALGRRIISFWRSPNGLIFEVMQILEARQGCVSLYSESRGGTDQ